tara:strand:- start:462 stop:704 length:243 start_codon:yes stop_codon:yes gene_type:complete
MTKATKTFYYGLENWSGCFVELSNVSHTGTSGSAVEAYSGSLPDGTLVHASGMVSKGLLVPENVQTLSGPFRCAKQPMHW